MIRPLRSAREGAGEGAAAGEPLPPPVALTVAGSDSGGGAGIQADLKTFHAFGVFGTSAVTAITAQNTLGVFGIHKIPPGMVAAQIRLVTEDLHPSAAKTGMLADAEIAAAVADALATASLGAVVVDPVMVAASGDRLLEEEAVETIRRRLLPLAALVTPNLGEAEILAGIEVRDQTGMREAARRIAGAGAGAVLLKGGHLPGDEVVDLLFAGGEFREWRCPRLHPASPHGTGCTLSAAVAAGLARGAELGEAVEAGLAFTRRAIAGSPRLGAGHRPLDHWAPVGPGAATG